MNFEIDFHRAKEMVPLNWGALPDAHVEMSIAVDPTGRVAGLVARRDFGYPAAADTIWNALKTWKYKPYKSGVLSFIFNTQADLISIDTTGLTTAGALQICRVKNSKLYYVSNNRGMRVKHH
jgi:hypothetical protein